MQYLKNIHTLNIYCNEFITNYGLQHMHNIHTINLYKNKNNDSNKYYNILDNSDSDLINHDQNLAKIIKNYKKYIPNIKYSNFKKYNYILVQNQNENIKIIHAFTQRYKINVNDIVYLSVGVFELGPLVITQMKKK
jgi:hypothetical protein